jgi:hypothetical protein
MFLIEDASPQPSSAKHFVLSGMPVAQIGSVTLARVYGQLAKTLPVMVYGCLALLFDVGVSRSLIAWHYYNT